MAKKIYLSPALHGSDNPTKCPMKCSENTHCGQYMDVVEKRLKALGFSVKRGGPATGTDAMYDRVAESNKWGADLHYAAHTNAGGGRYSMTMCWGDSKSKKLAKILHKHRKTVPTTHKVVTRKDLYEIRATAGICLYDELIFHDNATDCKWFHNGNLEKMAEETVKAICEMFGVTYKAETAAKAPAKKPAATTSTKTSAPKAGDKVTITKTKLYVSSTSKVGVTRTGTFYLYDGKKVSGRYRVTNSKSRVGKKPVALNVSGWLDSKYVK